MRDPDGGVPYLVEEATENFQQYFSHLKWEQMVAGIAGGSITTAILHPLELAKIRLQVNEGNGAVKTRPTSSRLLGTLQEVYNAKGAVGLYQGSVVNIVGNAVSWGLYFTLYGALKNYAQGGDTGKQLASAEYLELAAISSELVNDNVFFANCRKNEIDDNRNSLTAGRRSMRETVMIESATEKLADRVVSGRISHDKLPLRLYDLSMIDFSPSSNVSRVAVLWMTNPIWVAKTRMCLQYETIPFNDATSTSLKRLTVCRCLGEIWQSEGIRGFYRGILPGMFGVSSGALQFLLYEQFRNQYNGYYQRPIDTHLKAPEYLLMGIISKGLSTTLTYPFQVIRTRLQEQHRTYSSLSYVLKSIWKFEGMRGYYKGLLPNVLRTAPACGLMLYYKPQACQKLARNLTGSNGSAHLHAVSSLASSG
ncbi:hypothetical protein ACTXT7_001319 [Hymenolepis weldensis]